MKKTLFLLLSIIFLLPLASKASTEFNPGFLISDQEFLNSNSMSSSQIQKFLEKENSYLATYTTTSSYGQEKTAAQIIYDASANNYDCDGVTLSDKPTETERQQKCKKITTVNPKFLLVLLQKEQSLISTTNPKQSQLDWATGYGCPDSWACNPYYQGFGKQVNSAALQFRWYMLNPQNYKFKADNTYTFKNQYGTISNSEIEVRIENTATAALYNYTPHVYNGNYNFWKLWNKYFPSQGYTEGTVLKIADNYYLIQNGLSRKFASKSVLASRINPNKAIEVSPSALNAYNEGAPIKFSNYSIIMDPNGKLYLLVDSKKRMFASTAAFKALGYNVEEIMTAAWQDVNSYTDGKEITVATAYATGALLQDKKTGGVYFVEEDTKSPLIDAIFLTTKYKGKKITPVDAKDLESFTTVAPVKFDNGELLKSEHSPAVYLIENEQRRAFSSGEIFEGLGYKWSNIISVPDRVLLLYGEGEAISEVIEQ